MDERTMGEWYRRARRRVRRLVNGPAQRAPGTPDRYVEVDGDPIAGVYRAEWRTVVFPVELERLRWSRLGLPVDGARNPFVRVVQSHREGRAASFSGSALEAYYRSWQPETVGELFGLSTDDGPVAGQPPAGITLPWMAEAGVVDPSDRVAYADRWARIESARAGRELDLTHGHKLFGPVSDELGALEFERYTRIGESIAASGFSPFMDDEYIGVQILSDGGEWAAVATGPGLHRAAAAAALEVDPLVVAVDKHPRVVFRQDVEWWPGVRCGLFTRDAALAVFDRVLAGEPPAGFPH